MLDLAGRTSDIQAMGEQTHFDVIMVGGGLAGGLAALCLQRAGFSCALIDAQDPAAMRATSFDGRTTAISYASARVFKRIGVWDAIAPEAGPINDILVTDGEATGRFRQGHVSPLSMHFDSRTLTDADRAKTPLGWIAPNATLRQALFAAIADAPDITLIAPATRRAAAFDSGRASVTVADHKTGEEKTLTAALVIAADGKRSALRMEAGIKANHWRYKQSGIVATVSHERAHHGVAQEFFLPSGPFAILPMTENRSSLVWTEDSDAAPVFMGLDDEAFIAALTDRFGPYLGKVDLAGPRFSYPLSFHLSHTFIAPRLALIGDAARAIHPIAGQGYNLGVKDIAALTDVLTEARAVGLDIGAFNVLENYQRWRRFDSTTLALGTDVLNRLFSNRFAPIRLARRLGIAAVNRAAPLRTMFMRQAGADLGTLPSLMQPI